MRAQVLRHRKHSWSTTVHRRLPTPLPGVLDHQPQQQPICLYRLTLLFGFGSVACADTRHANSTTDPVAKYNTVLGSRLRARNVNVDKGDVLADCRRAAYKTGDIGSLLSAGNAGEVLEQYVGDVDSARELRADFRLDVEVTGVQDYRPVDILHVEVVERDVPDVSYERWAPGLASVSHGIKARSMGTIP